MRGRFRDLKGRRFGEWLVLGRAPDQEMPSGQRATMWRCRCSCGASQDVRACHLVRGMSTQCKGCADASHGYAQSVRLPDGRTILQIASASGLKLDTVYHRFVRGWPYWRLGEVVPRDRRARP